MDMGEMPTERRQLLHQTHGQAQSQAHGQTAHIPQVVNTNTASQSSQLRSCPAMQVAAAPQPAGILLADHMSHQVLIASPSSTALAVYALYYLSQHPMLAYITLATSAWHWPSLIASISHLAQQLAREVRLSYCSCLPQAL